MRLGHQEFEAYTISSQSAQEDAKVVSPKHRPPLPLEDAYGTYFC
jgi:hypothetical protein